MCLQPESRVQFWSTNLKNHRATERYIGKGKKDNQSPEYFCIKKD